MIISLSLVSFILLLIVFAIALTKGSFGLGLASVTLFAANYPPLSEFWSPLLNLTREEFNWVCVFYSTLVISYVIISNLVFKNKIAKFKASLPQL